MTEQPKRVNYDQVAPTYDDRYAANPMQPVADALSTLAREIGARDALEAGCGTGRWLASLAAAGLRVAGLDRSRGMLTKARQARGLSALVQGRGGALPFAPGSFDLVYVVNALHHFDAPQRFVAEAFRTLRPGGALAITGLDIGEPPRWYMYEFFPRAWEIDTARFPTLATLRGWLEAAGFSGVEERAGAVVDEVATGRDVLDDLFLRLENSSQLMLLTEAEYAEGLARIEQAIERAERTGATVAFRTHLRLPMLIGRKAG